MDEYDRTDCPHCGALFDPLPRAKKRCPSCGQQVWVRSCPDGRRYILREADLAAHEDRWETYRAVLADAEAIGLMMFDRTGGIMTLMRY